MCRLFRFHSPKSMHTEDVTKKLFAEFSLKQIKTAVIVAVQRGESCMQFLDGATIGINDAISIIHITSSNSLSWPTRNSKYNNILCPEYKNLAELRYLVFLEG